VGWDVASVTLFRSQISKCSKYTGRLHSESSLLVRLRVV
jgi:hypothetical protein